MLVENFKMAVAAILANKMRAFLTMLGIIIGIGSVIITTRSEERRVGKECYD